MLTATPALARARAVFDAAGYSESGVHDALGRWLSTGPDAPLDPLAFHALSPDEPLTVLLALFFAGGVIDHGHAASFLGESAVAALGEAQLLTRHGDDAWATVRVLPQEGSLFACDWLPQGRDCVPGPSGSSRMLAAVAPRVRVARALDLGTGCGVQAILAAAYADQVVATDVNARASAFAAANAVFNGGVSLDVRTGSWFDPVGDETFDLIMSNPPFVVSPDHEHLFRDSGERGDALARRLMRELPRHLREDGVAVVLVETMQQRGETWSKRVTSWLDASGCDALLFLVGRDDPLAHLARWLPDPNRAGRWLDYYRELGAETFSVVAAVLRKRSAQTNWVRAIELTGVPLRPAPDHVRRLLAAQDVLAGLDQDALCELALVPVPGQRAVEALTYTGDAYTAASVAVDAPGELPLSVDVDPLGFQALLRCGPGRRLGEAADAAAQALDVDDATVRAAALAAASDLLGCGLLAVDPG